MDVDTSSDEDDENDQECQEKLATAASDPGAYIDALLDFWKLKQQNLSATQNSHNAQPNQWQNGTTE
jgi:hypothetical protein